MTWSSSSIPTKVVTPFSTEQQSKIIKKMFAEMMTECVRNDLAVIHIVIYIIHIYNVAVH